MEKPDFMPENPHKGDSLVSYALWEEGRKVQLKTVIEWLEQPCTEHPSDYIPLDGKKIYALSRLTCPECWQELKLSL